jgi:UDP-glucose 4-epimerase
MKKALVTGAAGFIGANLTRRLLKDGHEVHVFVRPSSDLWRLETIKGQIHLHETNLMDETQLHALAQQIKPEWIFHLAAYGSYSWQTDVQRILQTNFLGTVNLLTAFLDCGFECFVNTGSSSEYGFKEHPPSEEELPEPNSTYAVAKVSATMFCRFTALQRKLQIPTLRIYNIYGPYEEPNRLIPALVLNGLQGRLPPLVHPDSARDLVYIDDLCDAYLCTASTALKDPGAVLNVGTGRQMKIRDIVESVRRVMGITEQPQWGSMSDRPWDTSTWIADSRKIRKELGWNPHFEFESGFRQTVEWFQSHPKRVPFYRGRYVPAR